MDALLFIRSLRSRLRYQIRVVFSVFFVVGRESREAMLGFRGSWVVRNQDNSRQKNQLLKLRWCTGWTSWGPPQSFHRYGVSAKSRGKFLTWHRLLDRHYFLTKCLGFLAFGGRELSAHLINLSKTHNFKSGVGAMTVAIVVVQHGR